MHTECNSCLISQLSNITTVVICVRIKPLNLLYTAHVIPSALFFSILLSTGVVLRAIFSREA